MASVIPKSYNAGAVSNSLYRFTQPWVALHYFKSFFLADRIERGHRLGYVSGPLGTDAVSRLRISSRDCFGLAWKTARNRSTRPIAFGILWFLLALLPTSLMPLAEVTNDHRMFFPFVGLALAVFWSLRIVSLSQDHRLHGKQRNHRRRHCSFDPRPRTDGLRNVAAQRKYGAPKTPLWADVVQKSPRNGRGLMNYGLTIMSKGGYASALSYFQRAETFTPNYWSLEVNLAIANGGLNQDAEARSPLLRAIQTRLHSGRAGFLLRHAG